MAKTSGSNGGLPNGDSNYKGKVGKLEPLASIKNPKVYKTVKESISRFHSVLGVRQKGIKIGQLEAGTGGVHISQNGVSKQVVLNKSVFNGKNTTTQSVAKWAEKRLQKRTLDENQQASSTYCYSRAGARNLEQPFNKPQCKGSK